MDNKLKLLMDPATNQIIQKLRVQGGMTTTEILDSGINISQATLYRKLNKMLAENVIEIRETRVVMGQIEKVYQIKEIYITKQSSNEDRLETVMMALMNISYQYEQYFQKEYVKTNIFDVKYSKILQNAFQIRNICDYDDFYLATKSSAE